MSEHYCMYKDGMCELDIDEAYQQGRANAFQEIAYSDSVIKEPFETLAYKKGKADAIEELIKLAHEDVTTGNMIISLADVAEQLKEQNNE